MSSKIQKFITLIALSTASVFVLPAVSEETSALGKTQEAVKAGTHAAKDQASEAAGAVKEKASHAAKEKAKHVHSKAADGVDALKDKVAK